MQNAQRRKVVLIAVLGFCLLELLDWTGITRGGFPSSWAIALIQAFINIGWTVLFTAVSYFVMIRPRRSSSAEDRPEGQGDSSTRG